MAIQIDSNHIRPATGNTTTRRRTSESDAKAPPAPRAHINFIPAPESLRTVIASAIEALRRGVHWDRGSILNLLV